MSISNLLQKNDYDIYMGSVDLSELVIANVSDDTKYVTLTVDSNNSLVIDGGKLFIDSLQFSTDGNQSIMNYYSVLTSSEASALVVLTPLGNTINLTSSSIKITRVGNLVTINLPNTLTENFNTGPNYGNISTPFMLQAGIPSRFRPSAAVACIYGYVNTHDEFVSSEVTIDASGIITWYPRPIAAGVPGVWDATLSTTDVDIYRTCFSYII